MEAVLEFCGKLKDTGEILIQRIPIANQEILQNPAEMAKAIQGILVQLGIGGMVHKDGNVMRLTPASRFESIWCEIPSIVIANAGESPVRI